jgi:hypothetical protein
MSGISIWQALVLLMFAINIIPAIRISRKMGYGWAMAIAMLIPLLSYVTFWYVAFIEWPNHTDRSGR